MSSDNYFTRVRGSGSVRGRGGGRGRGAPRLFTGDTRRDLEEELLILIVSEFQINCSEARPFNDIYDRVRQNNDLHAYVYNSPAKLREFIASYSENFGFNENCPNMVYWKKTRIVSKRDPKEARRRERKIWDKTFEDVMIAYDIGLEEHALSFITALFILTDESWLPTNIIETTLRIAFREEVDLMDYAGANVRNFLIKRDHIFKEHLEYMHFYGRNAYEVTYRLNEFVRGSVQVKNRETIRRLHEFYLASSSISDEAREELQLDERKKFCEFLNRCFYVFNLDETHVESKRDLPMLTFDMSRVQNNPNFKPVLQDFVELQMRKRPEASDEPSDSVTYVIDSHGNPRRLGVSIDRPSGSGAASGAGARRQTRPDSPSTTSTATLSISDATSSSTLRAGGSDAASFVENPFEKRRLAAENAQLASGRTAAAAPRFGPSRGVDARQFLKTPCFD